MLSSYSQGLKSQFEIKKGPIFSINKSDFHNRILPKEDGGFFSVETTLAGVRKKFVLIHFDKQLKKINENEIKIKFANGKHEFEDIFYINKKLYLLSSNKDNDAQTNSLYLRTINETTLEPNSDSKVLATVSYEDYSKFNSGGFNLQFSKDKSKLMIFQFKPRDRNSDMAYTITMLDVKKNMDLIWSKTFSSTMSQKLEDIMQKKVTNEGDAIVLLKQYDDKRKDERKGEPNYNYEIKQITDNGEAIDNYPIVLKNQYITDVQLGINDNGDFLCTGFYSPEYRKGISGCYFMLLDQESKTVKKESKQEFSIDFLTDFMKEGKAKRMKKKDEKGKAIELVNYDMGDIVLRDDGGVVQVAEQNYTRSNTYIDANGNSRTTYTYHFNTLIVISISPEGEIDWSRKIPKYQAASLFGSAWASYYMNVVNNKMYFFHIGNAKNLLAEDYGDLKGWSLGKKSVLVATELNVEGYSQKDVILDANTDKTIVMPKFITKNDSDELIVFAKYKKKARYYKLIIKE